MTINVTRPPCHDGRPFFSLEDAAHRRRMTVAPAWQTVTHSPHP